MIHSASTSDSSTPSAYIARAHRVFMKRKHPNTTPQFLISRPRSSRTCSLHLRHTNTQETLIQNLPFSPQYTYYNTENESQHAPYVD